MKKVWIAVPLGLGALCLVLTGISFLSNLGLPESSQIVERLSEQEKARLLEATHLRESLGNQVWPGWQDLDIPVIVYNESFAFLVGLPDPTDGWLKVPQEQKRGGAWEIIVGDSFDGRPYYRQALPDSKLVPENFTVLVGDRWVATLETKEFMQIAFVKGLSSDLPPVVRSVFPYRLAWRLLVNGSDGYISALLHEQFHAFQGIQAADRLATAERAVLLEDQYPWDQPNSEQSWKQELDILYQAATAKTDVEAVDLARRFLSARDQRRHLVGLNARLISFEREREWLEGLAKYAELEIGRLAAESPDYQPVIAIKVDADFKNYTGRAKFWAAQLNEVRRMTNNDSEVRFYYTGLTEAVVLDRLMPDWKATGFSEGVYLEDLLRMAVE